MKKVLTIVLSVAMVICLMPAMAFAADATTTADNTTKATGLAQFSDADSITNKEAVSVLTGLHIINGMGDGTFQPKGDVTRAQTATMISILVRGGKTDTLAAPSKDPFTDVAKDNWAAPYVAYGANQGYINGKGDGTYGPDENVTTAQMATILVQILGVSKTDAAYNWPENVMAFAKQFGLLTDISKGANENLDREEAAQMIFNALKADDVIKTIVEGSDFTNYDSVKGDPAKDYDETTTATDETEQLVEKLFPKATLTTKNADPFGRDSKVWMNGRNQITEDATKAPVLTYTAAQDEDALKADLKGYDLSKVEVIKNGQLDNGNKENAEAKEVSDIKDLTGNGVLVELYANDKDTAITKAVVADYDLVKVSGVNPKTGDINLENGAVIEKDASFYDAVSSVAQDDRVLVAMSQKEANKVLDAYLPTKVTGPVTATTVATATKPATATVNGTKYEAAATPEGQTYSITTDDYSLFLDKYGYIKGQDDVDDEKAADYLYVVTRYVGQDKYNTKTVYVQAVDETGAVKEDLKVANTNEAGTGLKDDAEGVFPENATLYSYKETAKGYVFFDTESNDKSSHVNDATVENNGTIKADAKTINGVYVSKSVKTIDVDGSGSTLKVSANDGLKTLKSGKFSYVVKNDGKNNLVTTVFRTEDVSAPNSVFIHKIIGDATYEGENGTIPGKTVEYYTADKAEPQEMIVSDADNLELNAYYDVTADGQGFAIDKKSDVQGTPAAKIDKAYGSNVTFGDSSFDIKGDAAVRDLRTDDEIDNLEVNKNYVTKIDSVDKLVAAVAKNDVQVIYKTDEDGKNIVEIYVVNVTPTPTTTQGE